MSFWDGLASAMDDVRHKVVEEPTYGREVTGNIEPVSYTHLTLPTSDLV